MGTHLVLLPRTLPFGLKGNEDLHRYYSGVPKRGAVEAESSEDAINNFLYRGFGNKGVYKIIRGKLKGHIFRAEVFTAPFVSREYQAIELACEMARERQCSPVDCYMEARDLILQTRDKTRR